MKFLMFVFFGLIFSFEVNAVLQNYRADVFDIHLKTLQPDFTFELSETRTLDALKITGVFKKDNNIALFEEALINESTAEVIQYKIDQKQTKESGFIEVTDKKIKIKYIDSDQIEKKVEINKPEYFVAPANFDRWLQKNFLMIKDKKSFVFDFLVWDKLDTYKFKIKYLGEVELRGKKMHQFKMNIDNAIVATFLDPIIIWYNLDMTEIQQYQGLVAVKLGQSPKFKKMEAVVKYFH